MFLNITGKLKYPHNNFVELKYKTELNPLIIESMGVGSSVLKMFIILFFRSLFDFIPKSLKPYRKEKYNGRAKKDLLNNSGVIYFAEEPNAGPCRGESINPCW